MLPFENLFLGSELEPKSNKHLFVILFSAFDDGVAELADGVHDELSKGPSDRFALVAKSLLFPLFGIVAEEIITPTLFHHLLEVGVKFLGIESCELGECEGPLFFSRAEGDVSS